MSKNSYLSHYSVLKSESLGFLKLGIIKDNSSPYIFADMTFGAGGHTFALINMDDNIKVIAVDQDPEAYQNGIGQIKALHLEDRVTFLNCNFIEFSDRTDLGGQFLGVLMDLGVSSHHFDKDERGFSFRFDAPLDMRMDINSDRPTAAEVVNEYSLEDLTRIFTDYGEDRFSKRIAENIVEERLKKRIKTTKDLENIIFHSYPKKMRFSKTNPSTKCFQALRIYVNDELNILEQSISKMYSLLAPGGVLVIISFHSLEDRIVKHAFKRMKSTEGGIILTKRPIVPGEKELEENRRSRSAKLRAIQSSH